MAFSFTTTSEYIQKSPLEDKTDLLEGMFEAQEAYNTLLQAGVELSSTEAMLADIQETLYSISQPHVGQESLEMFGTAESFQSLYDKPIVDLSRAEAMEGLGDALKKVWDKLVAWIKDIFDAIFKFIKAILFTMRTFAAHNWTRSSHNLENAGKCRHFHAKMQNGTGKRRTFARL